MGLFNRRARAVDADTTTATGTTLAPTRSTTREKILRASGGFMGVLRGRQHGSYPETMNSRPTFGQWLQQSWIDLVTMIILAVIAGVVSHSQSICLSSWIPSFHHHVSYEDLRSVEIQQLEMRSMMFWMSY